MKIVQYLKHIYFSITMLFKFFNVVWKFRGYDWEFNLMVLKKSFSLSIESHKNAKVKHIGQEESIKQMERVVELIDKIVKDNYADDFGYNYDIVNSDKFIFNKNGDKVTLHLKEDIKNKNTEAIKLGNEACEKDWDELFLILKNHLREWWW